MSLVTNRCLCLCLAANFLAVPTLLLWLPAVLHWLLDGRLHRTLLPIDLPWLLWFKGRHQTRTLGRTPAGDRAAYKEVNMTDEEKSHYFEHGYVVLRDVVDRGILDALRDAIWQELGPASWPWAHSTFMTVDGVLDFYIFSNLPSIAAQLFGSPQTDLKERGPDGKATTHFFSDFHYFRPEHQFKVVELHADDNEREGILPASHVSTSRLRFWVTLDDDVVAPIVINQSFLVSYMNNWDKWDFFTGRGRGIYSLDYLTWLQATRGFPSTREEKIWTVLPRVRRGDVVLHSPCLIHTSPPPLGRPVAFLCVTYAPGESRVFSDRSAGAPGRACRRKLRVGEHLRGSSDVCLPQVYPANPELLPGTKVHYEASDYHPWAAFKSWFWWRQDKLLDFFWPDTRQPKFSM